MSHAGLALEKTCPFNKYVGWASRNVNTRGVIDDWKWFQGEDQPQRRKFTCGTVASVGTQMRRFERRAN
jgi:hypothetical protein